MEISVLIELLVPTSPTRRPLYLFLLLLRASASRQLKITVFHGGVAPLSPRRNRHQRGSQSYKTQNSFRPLFFNSLKYIMTSLPISRDEAISRHLHMNADAFALRLHRDSFISTKKSFAWGGFYKQPPLFRYI